jgi:hypothetical protein
MHWGQDPFWREMVMTDGDTFLRSDYATIHFEGGPEGAVRRMVFWTWPGGTHLSFDKDQVLQSNAPAAPENPQHAYMSKRVVRVRRPTQSSSHEECCSLHPAFP